MGLAIKAAVRLVAPQDVTQWVVVDVVLLLMTGASVQWLLDSVKCQLTDQSWRLFVGFTALDACASADFLFLHRLTGLTVGNLSAHLAKLEEAQLVTVDKQFIGRIPNTQAAITKEGRAALRRHWRGLQRLRKGGADLRGQQTALRHASQPAASRPRIARPAVGSGASQRGWSPASVRMDREPGAGSGRQAWRQGGLQQKGQRVARTEGWKR